MKKVIAQITLTLLVLSFAPASLKAEEFAIPLTKEAESAKAEVLLTRLNEINAMEKKNLNGAEKRELRNEVRAIKKDLNTMDGGGVYISVGAIIIIILLLILLL